MVGAAHVRQKLLPRVPVADHDVPARSLSISKQLKIPKSRPAIYRVETLPECIFQRRLSHFRNRDLTDGNIGPYVVLALRVPCQRETPHLKPTVL
jgi:hypothetical protein